MFSKRIIGSWTSRTLVGLKTSDKRPPLQTQQHLDPSKRPHRSDGELRQRVGQNRALLRKHKTLVHVRNVLGVFHAANRRALSHHQSRLQAHKVLERILHLSSETRL